MPDRFSDTLRHVAADPGAIRSRTTVSDSPPLLPDARETYVLESVKLESGTYIFLEVIDSQG